MEEEEDARAGRLELSPTRHAALTLLALLFACPAGMASSSGTVQSLDTGKLANTIRARAAGTSRGRLCG